MKTSKVTSVSVAAAAVAAIALSGSPVAQSAAVQPFGTREILADPGGMMVTAYTVTGLAPSSDVIPYRVMGRLYEANVTVEAERGTITPVIPPFTARAAAQSSSTAGTDTTGTAIITRSTCSDMALTVG